MQAAPNPEIKLAGFLAPLFAVRGKDDLGIGDTSALRELVDWAGSHGFGFVQMLPVNETGGDHSPYNLLSSMALDPATISCLPGSLPGLDAEEFERLAAWGSSLREGPVQYDRVKALKRTLLEAACKNFFRASKFGSPEFREFCRSEQDWLDPYCLCRALSDWNEGIEDFSRWPEPHRSLPDALEWVETLSVSHRRRLDSFRRFHRFSQWVAWSQWSDVARYAAGRGVLLVGDVPVGVGIHSVDVWADPHLFDTSRSCGAPPEKVFRSDPFTEQWGQNWGFPLYDWFAMSHDNFQWWRRRLRALRKIFPILRIDHALGFFRIFSFPWRPERNGEFMGLTEEQARAKTGGLLPCFVPNDDDTPEHREANRTHGETLLGILIEETGPEGMIAEDLGQVPPYVRPALASLGVSGFKIPQWELDPNGDFLPGSAYPRMAITTYATHDHPPLVSMWEEKRALAATGTGVDAENARKELVGYLKFCGLPTSPIPAFSNELLGALMKALFNSNAWLAAANINDLFGTPDRFNVPGTSCGQNWTARLAVPIDEWDDTHAAQIATWHDGLPRQTFKL